MHPQKNLVLGTAGHIDHGKTALVRALTGINTDRLPAEQARGITIDLGFAWLDLGEFRLGLVDVPGHERFVRNMLAGATGLDLALLVVAADDSVMPQTREHLEILRLLDLAGGAIALTKCDLVDADWLTLVEDDIRRLTEGSFLEGAEIVRTSAVTGEGIGQLRDALLTSAQQCSKRHDSGLFRMAIDRSFTVAGHGTVVTGTVVSGGVRVGDELDWLPEGRTVRVRGLRQHDHDASALGRGSRAAINLVGAHHTEVVRGQELGAPAYLKPTRVLSVELYQTADATRAFRHRTRYKLHLGTAELSATLSFLELADEPNDGPRLAQLLLDQPAAAVHAQPFILRQESPAQTLGGGRVLATTIRRLRRRDDLEIAYLRHLRAPEPQTRLRAALALYGLRPWTREDLVRETGIAEDQLDESLASLEASGSLVDLAIGPRRVIRVLAEVAGELEDRVLRALARLHAARPRQSAVRRTHLSAELPDLGSDALVACLLERLISRGAVTADRWTVALKGHEPKLSQAERRFKLAVREALEAGGFSPPDMAELKALAAAQAKVLPELLAILVDEGEVVELARDLYLASSAEHELRHRVTERLADGSSLTMSELRDLLGTTRKFAVPIAEYLDRIGVTFRDGDLRRLGSSEASVATAQQV
jgi:selenocysteine-specific elongation factor